MPSPEPLAAAVGRAAAQEVVCTAISAALKAQVDEGSGGAQRSEGRERMPIAKAHTLARKVTQRAAEEHGLARSVTLRATEELRQAIAGGMSLPNTRHAEPKVSAPPMPIIGGAEGVGSAHAAAFDVRSAGGSSSEAVLSSPRVALRSPKVLCGPLCSSVEHVASPFTPSVD